MGSNSSGEDLVVKARKPYTISKQREPWTEEEHNRFLEALKLYGRAWQRIEEHIGTKTAVQIRSHAQKFFSKLEKEALTKGASLGKTLDIEIPPPRPKRKPCSPYPRKTGTGSLCPTREAADEKPSESASSPINNKQLLDSKSNDPREIPVANESLQTRNEASQDVGCSEVLNLFHDAYSASISSSNKASSIASSCSEFVPLMKVIEEKTAVEKNDTSDADPDSGKLHGAKSQTKPAQVESTDELKQSERQHPSSKGNPFLNTTAFATPDTPSYSEVSSIYQSFPPFTQSQRNQDAYRSIHSIPSTLSNLIVTTLLQNPAVHAAATLTATSFFPPPGMDCLINSSSNISPGEMPPRHMNPSPSVAAIASATVAAASAWWAAQGLLPLFPPLHPGFAFAPPPTTLIPIMEMSRAPEAINDASLRATSSSSSESDDRERVEISCFTEPKPSESDKARCKKPDRSSCGSNTPSSSEVETDTVLKKHEEDKDESKQIQLDCPPPAEVHNRRSRSCCNINDSWKEVSDEGRLAFRALFSRDVLPQSFSAQDAEDTMVILGGDKEDTSLQVFLGNRSSTAVTDLCDVQGSAEKAGGSTSIGSGSMLSESGHWKMKTRRTGFKPYKRCSVEAKGSGAMADGEENSSKRMRLEGEASI